MRNYREAFYSSQSKVVFRRRKENAPKIRNDGRIATITTKSPESETSYEISKPGFSHL